MADDVKPTTDSVAFVRGHLLEAMSLIDELERSMRPWADPAEPDAGDE